MVKIRPLSSAANPLLKDVRRAIARGAQTDEGLAVAEGFHLFEEAIRSGCEVPRVLAAESAREKVERLVPADLAILPDALFESISSTTTSQGVMALVRLPEWTASRIFGSDALAVILDGIQDPGNAGAIVRSAEAFGASGVVFLKGAASPFHPKTLRASAGSLFRVPFLTSDSIPANHVRLYAAMPWSLSTCKAADMDLVRPCGLIIGSEGRGVQPELLQTAVRIAIPTESVESLNAAMAASILLYEAHRQRQLAESRSVR